jgi:hypothetical protein
VPSLRSGLCAAGQQLDTWLPELGGCAASRHSTAATALLTAPAVSRGWPGVSLAQASCAAGGDVADDDLEQFEVSDAELLQQTLTAARRLLHLC